MRYSRHFGGWVFFDVPTRTMSRHARFRALVDRSEYEHTDHTGEPYVYEVCPFCGHDLPDGEDYWPRECSHDD